MVNSRGTFQRTGNAQQWAVSILAICLTAGLVIWFIMQRPDPPHFDELRIDSNPTSSSTKRRGPRLVIEENGRTRIKVLDSPSFRLQPGELLTPESSPGPFTTKMLVPIAIEEPMEAAIVADYADCTIQVIHNQAILATGEALDEPAQIQTEPLAFPIGNYEFAFLITSTGEAPRWSVSWIVDELVGPVPIPQP